MVAMALCCLVYYKPPHLCCVQYIVLCGLFCGGSFVGRRGWGERRKHGVNGFSDSPIYRLEMHATVVCLKEAGLGFISNVSVLSNNISSVVMCGSKKQCQQDQSRNNR